MTYREHLEKILCYSSKTADIYTKYSGLLIEHDLDYKKAIISLNNLSNNTLRVVMSSFKSYYKFLRDDRYKDILLPKKETVVKGFVTFEEYKNYLKKINRKTKTGYQMRIIIRLLFETGIRSSELLQINKMDIDGNSIKIKGKGKKERIVKISNWLHEEILEYSKSMNNKLFNFGYKNLYARVGRLEKDKKISPHMFRRGYAKYCHDNGISIYDISLSMGHSSVETTAGYIKRESEDVDIFKLF